MHKLRTPDFSKLTSARALSMSHGAELATPFKDHWAIFRERCTIEGELANATRGSDGEYELQDVLARLLERVLIPMDNMDLLALAEGLAKLELQFELRHTYSDPTISAFSRDFPAEQTLFLSDAERIQRLLQHHALDGLVEDGISSCDVDVNKHSGKLFHHVHARFGIPPGEHVHIGDNPHADVEVPQRLRIRAVHFQPEAEHNKRQARAAYLHDRLAMYRQLAEEVRRDAGDEAEGLQGEARSAYLLGIRAAPLLIGFILHIAERALLDGVDRLFFFTREGELFIRVWRAVFPDNRLAGLELPPVDLLEVSRIATFCASLREISTSEMMRLWNLYSTQSIFSLLKTLGLEPEDYAEVCQAHGLKLKEDLVYPWQDARVQTLFQDPRFASPIQAKVDDDRSRLLAYLDQHGWRSDVARVGIVDIGWRGTIQDNLAYLLPDCLISGYYLGLQRFLNPQPKNCSKSALGPDANQPTDYLNLLDAVSLIEMLCNSPNGSVTGYSRAENGRMSADRLVDEGENAVHHAFVTHFQKGALFASRLWADFVDSHVIVSGELREPGCAIWHEMVTKTHQDLAQAYASLSHNEVFGMGGFVDKRAVPSLWQLFHGAFSRRVRQEVILYIRQTQWVAGIWGRKDLGLIHRMLLMGMLLLGRGYKNLRYFGAKVRLIMRSKNAQL